jgi:hypothetical protein
VDGTTCEGSMKTWATIVALLSLGLTACGGSDDSTFDTTIDSGDPGFSNGEGGTIKNNADGGPSGPCVNLQCQQHSCNGGATTTVTGKVYDPAGKNPLYDVVVYVPNSAVQPFASGATCDSCGSLYTGNPIVTALTDASGSFTLKNVPDGANIPLVVQIGKWRRQFKIPNVTQCGTTSIADKTLTLPKTHAEGDIPNIAVSTGGADTLECLLKRVGLAESEYGPGASGAGRIHIFQGSPTGVFGFGGAPNTAQPAPKSADSLWDSANDINKYDLVLLSCEGAETANMNQQVLVNYAAAGGRVFASHFHYSWFNSGTYGSSNLATWTPGSNNIGDITGSIVTTLPNNAPFPKGVALQQWLGNVNALTGGKLPIQAARHNANVSAANTPSQAWIVADGTNATEYFSFDTPLNTAPEKQCGRTVFSDLHVGAASGDYQGPFKVTPTGCTDKDLSPQEKALEFMLFDLSSCVQPNGTPPAPPTPTPN